MAIYMIGYDLQPKPGETYNKLIEAIKRWVPLTGIGLSQLG